MLSEMLSGSQLPWCSLFLEDNTASVFMKLIMPQRGGQEGAMNLLSRPQLFLLTLALSSLTKEKGHKDTCQSDFLGS